MPSHTAPGPSLHRTCREVPIPCSRTFVSRPYQDRGHAFTAARESNEMTILPLLDIVWPSMAYLSLQGPVWPERTESDGAGLDLGTGRGPTRDAASWRSEHYQAR